MCIILYERERREKRSDPVSVIINLLCYLLLCIKFYAIIYCVSYICPSKDMGWTLPKLNQAQSTKACQLCSDESPYHSPQENLAMK